MNWAELVRLVTNALFLVVFVGALRTALRERSKTSVDATILFGALAVVVAQSQIASILGTQLPQALSLVSALLFLALPYLQLRLVDDFAGLRPLVLRVCLGGLVLGIVATGIGFLQLVYLPAAVPPEAPRAGPGPPPVPPAPRRISPTCPAADDRSGSRGGHSQGGAGAIGTDRPCRPTHRHARHRGRRRAPLVGRSHGRDRRESGATVRADPRRRDARRADYRPRTTDRRPRGRRQTSA